MSRVYSARTVLAQRIRERRLTLEEFSEQLELFARENNEVGTVSIRHAQRLAAGEHTSDQLRPATTRLLEKFFESPIEELLASPETRVYDKNEPETDVEESIGESHIRHPVDGRLMAKIDGSVFLSGPGNEPTWLPTFYIDVYPVTNAEYARFIAATGHTPPQHWTDERPPEHLSDHPVVLVTWNDAAAYAEWAGKSLPSGQQWEKTARGTRGTVYPWGDQPTPAKCNVRENGVGSTTTVDCYKSGVSPYGVFDLCGNIWEWCSTETRPSRHELKGGAWTSPFLRATPSSFNDAAASMCDDDTGFRCVVTAETLNR
jgi:formylglycine-generating enzyme required for sulfatase activity